MNNSIFKLTLISFLVLIACDDPKEENRPPPRDLTAAEKSLVSSDNAFGLNVFKALSQGDPDSNLFISPLSISMALGMTLNGAADSTYEAMKSTLELAGLSETEINESYQSLIELLINMDPKVAFKIANSIWYKEGLPVYEGFIQTNKTYFDAEVAALDFSDPKAVDRINDWVSENTNELIQKIIAEIPADMVMYLINAIYFKGDWRFQFDLKDTKNGTFFNDDDSESTLPMMTQKLSAPMGWNDETTIVDLPYGDSLFTMTIFLPSGDIDQFVSDLSPQKLSNWIDQLAPASFDLTMPRFELEYEKKLNEILSDLGMAIAFDGENADFSRIMPLDISGNLYISEVKHKTYIKVDEEGTEAAAVTSVGIGITSGSPRIVIDHPFVFAIRENHAGTILFLGKILKL
ncbi:MAG: serpin family protein [Candidatus Marinimicrobia bacterium]|nr:serpin family protein [Candidatus Neomarinimicrobiota bacterium]MBL7031232.1 serpin family protein [Candidatus Neomarinimicrobiota bacterium]